MRFFGAACRAIPTVRRLFSPLWMDRSDCAEWSNPYLLINYFYQTTRVRDHLLLTSIACFVLAP